MQINDIKYITQNFVPIFDFLQNHSIWEFVVFINASVILDGAIHLDWSQIINWNLRSDDGSDLGHFIVGEGLSSGVDPDEVHWHHVTHWSEAAVLNLPSVVVGADDLERIGSILWFVIGLGDVHGILAWPGVDGTFVTIWEGSTNTHVLEHHGPVIASVEVVHTTFSVLFVDLCDTFCAELHWEENISLDLVPSSSKLILIDSLELDVSWTGSEAHSGVSGTKDGSECGCEEFHLLCCFNFFILNRLSKAS